jgi:hypothetical protein
MARHHRMHQWTLTVLLLSDEHFAIPCYAAEQKLHSSFPRPLGLWCFTRSAKVWQRDHPRVREVIVGGFRICAAAAVALGVVGPAQASVVTFTGFDNTVSSLAQMTNSVAAEAAFGAAVPGASTITFETPLPSNVNISGGSITNNSGCGALCGFNTTPGGQSFYLQFGGTATFTFSSPINAFGFYVTGLQTNAVPQETLTFFDGSQRTINTPPAIGGGGAFIGFTDLGASITSLSYNATNDIVAIDDVRFSGSRAVPSPIIGAGMPGLIAACGGVLAWWRRKRRAQTAA